MTRREWLTQNPPPRAAKSTQALLDGLNAQNAERARVVELRQKWVTHRDYWQARIGFPGDARIGFPGEQAQAQQQMADANTQIAEADKVLAASQDVPGRILQLQEELKKTARCPTHGNDLYRNMNRPEDMFTCEVGPHQLFWTRLNGQGALLVLDTLALPGLEFPMTDGTKISRAQWLASHPAPIPSQCPTKPAHLLVRNDTRADLFACPVCGSEWLWTPTASGPTEWRSAAFVPAGNVPSLEDPV
jgi:hypothetical protein